jgi:hypothetical protein
MLRSKHKIHKTVMAGLDPAIHAVADGLMLYQFPWMPGSRPGMTTEMTLNHLNASEH